MYSGNYLKAIAVKKGPDYIQHFIQ